MNKRQTLSMIIARVSSPLNYRSLGTPRAWATFSLEQSRNCRTSGDIDAPSTLSRVTRTETQGTPPSNPSHELTER